MVVGGRETLYVRNQPVTRQTGAIATAVAPSIFHPCLLMAVEKNADTSHLALGTRHQAPIHLRWHLVCGVCLRLFPYRLPIPMTYLSLLQSYTSFFSLLRAAVALIFLQVQSSQGFCCAQSRLPHLPPASRIRYSPAPQSGLPHPPISSYIVFHRFQAIS